MSYIYILTNESMPGLVKIGMTSRHPRARAKEMRTTGVPTPFKVSGEWKVPEKELKKLERKCHYKLRKHRVDSGREFFKLSLDEAKQAIEEIISEQQLVWRQKEEQKKEHIKRIAERQKATERKLAEELKAKAQKEQETYKEIPKPRVSGPPTSKPKVTLKKPEPNRPIDKKLETENLNTSYERIQKSPTYSSPSPSDEIFSRLSAVVFLPLKYFWITAPILAFIFVEGSIEERIFIALISPIGVIAAAVSILPILAMIGAPILNLFVKISGSGKQEPPDPELLRRVRGNSPIK